MLTHSHRISLVITKGASDRTHHWSNQDFASGRSCRRHFSEADSGRGHIFGRTVYTASYRRSPIIFFTDTHSPVALQTSAQRSDNPNHHISRGRNNIASPP